MIVKIILCVCILPLLPIMYFLFVVMGKEQNHALFGITLWQDALKEERVQNLVQDYKKQLKRMILFLFLVQFLAYLPKYFSIVMILWMIWLFAAIALPFIPYIRANKKMRTYRAEYQIGHNENTQNSTYVDLTAAMEEKTKYFWKATLIACIAGFIPAVLAVILDKTLKASAAPELWVMEIVLLSMALVGVICFLVLHYYNQQPVTAYTTDSDVNIQFSRVKKYQWCRCFGTLAWLNAIFNGLILAGFYLDSAYMTGFLIILCMLYCVIPMVLVGVSYHVIQKQKEKLLEGRELLLSEDDENWIWGLFYYNKNDSRFCVDKKVGIGVTTNMAKPAAKVLTVGVLVFTVVICIGAGVFCAVEEFTPVKLEYENQQITAVHWKEEYQIHKNAIKSITLLDEIPSMSKSNGTGMDTVYKGTFFSREYERRFKVCLNPQAEPVIMIETTNGSWYLLGDSDSEKTEEIYKELTK